MAKSFPVFGDRRQRRIGLLGGSFNPAHEGHLHISREAIKRLGLHQVWWLVSPQNPLKPKKGMAPLAQRLAGAKMMAADVNLIAGDLETRLGNTHTAAVVAILRRRYPRIQFVWLMGADNLEQIPRWWRWTRIFHRVRVAVLDRSPYAYRALAGAAALRFRRARIKPSRALAACGAPAWSYLAIRRHPASGTALRMNTQTTNSTQEIPITTNTAPLDLEKTVELIMAALEDGKAQNIVQFDLTGKTSVADRMVVASGTSTRQVTALAENLSVKLKAAGAKVRSEGKKQGDWVLVDAGDVIVHLFRPEVRAFYDIERLWATPVAKPTPATKLKSKAKSAPKAKPKAKRKIAKRR